MEIIYVENEVEGGKKAFEILKEELNNGAKTLGLATGSTPETLYQEMLKSDLDFSDITAINLDEYIGLGLEDVQSYHYFMDDKLFQHKPFKNTFLPDGEATNLEEECKRYDAILEEHPVDVQLLGVGNNAHIGFNEPGTDFTSKTHTVDLTESTINANKRYFDSVDDVPTRAITMGLGSIMEAKKIIFIAYGEGKADAIKKMIDGPVTEDVPASVLKNHENITVILDKAAASKLDAK